jgi:hypothetical protein
LAGTAPGRVKINYKTLTPAMGWWCGWVVRTQTPILHPANSVEDIELQSAALRLIFAEDREDLFIGVPTGFPRHIQIQDHQTHPGSPRNRQRLDPVRRGEPQVIFHG